MKSVLIAAAAMLAFAGIGPAGAQNYGPTYGNTIHQSAGDRDARGTPKYYQPARPYASRQPARPYASRHASRPHSAVRIVPRSTTTGAGSSGP